MAQADLIGHVILGYRVVSRLGSGAFGTVYKVQKENPSGVFVRALKHITIPSGNQYMSVLNSMGGDTAKADSYFSNKLEGILSEIKNLNNLTEKGARNIVRYYENDIIIQESPRRYDIYILMEYLTPLEDYRMEKPMTVQDVIRLGKDVLQGIGACHENGIIHRDIKEDNIFISAAGEFKIGDFGVSKALQGSSRAESMKGTPNYLAPEVYQGKEAYSKNVDLYSLGIVLYRLLNYDRNPFLPPYPSQYFPENEDEAFRKRMEGEVPGLPVLGGPCIGEVIVKAISGREERFQNAEEFLKALEKAEQKTDKAVLETPVAASTIPSASDKVLNTFEDYDATIGEIPVVPEIPGQKKRAERKDNDINRNLFESTADFGDNTPPVFPSAIVENEPQTPKKSRMGLIAGVVSLCLVLAIGLFFLFNPFGKEKQYSVSALDETSQNQENAGDQESKAVNYSVVSEDIPSFDARPVYVGNGHFIFSSNGRYGVIDSNGEVLLEDFDGYALRELSRPEKASVNFVGYACVYNNPSGQGMDAIELQACNINDVFPWSQEYASRVISKGGVVVDLDTGTSNSSASGQYRNWQQSMAYTIVDEDTYRNTGSQDIVPYYVYSEATETLFGPYEAGEHAFFELKPRLVKNNYSCDSIFYNREDGKYRIYNKDATESYPDLFDYAEPVSDDYMLVKSGEKTGLIDTDFNLTWVDDAEDITGVDGSRAYGLIDGSWKLIDLASGQNEQSADASQDEQTGQDQSAQSELSETGKILKDFIDSGAYKKAVGNAADLSYAIVDLTGDGVEELLIQSETENPIYSTWTFMVDNGQVKQAAKTEGYSSYRYSPKLSLVVPSSLMEPGDDFTVYNFEKLDLDGYSMDFMIEVYNGDEFFFDTSFDPDGEKEAMSRDQYDQIMASVSDLNWTPLA